ncbi:MAG: uracil-DNA glycosylase family protein [Patescibacteria group bacterium]|nr:uracil-DNA glycosylase family protein [Patescibacteria group bacterium]
MENSNDNRTELLKQIRDEIWNLKESPLYQYRIQDNVYPVIGEGNHYAKIMFIGEAPGKTEAETSRPFAGAAGKILTELVESIGLLRKDVYITNIVKDRPPNNRDPFPDEINIYAPFLDRQIEIIQPEIIATLGRYSMAYIMEKFGLDQHLKGISNVHGNVFGTQTARGKIKIIPLYHPAVALYRRELKTEMLKDFQTLKELIK